MKLKKGIALCYVYVYFSYICLCNVPVYISLGAPLIYLNDFVIFVVGEGNDGLWGNESHCEMTMCDFKFLIGKRIVFTVVWFSVHQPHQQRSCTN